MSILHRFFVPMCFRPVSVKLKYLQSVPAYKKYPFYTVAVRIGILSSFTTCIFIAGTKCHDWLNSWSKRLEKNGKLLRYAYASIAAPKENTGWNTVADVVEQVGSAVVSVTTSFGWNIERPPKSIGSGFIIDPSGYLLTNAHVVGTNAQVQVKMSDGTIYKGRVTAVDMYSDLALIKIDPGRGKQLPYLSLGSTKKLRPGDFVIALGSPLSLSNTVTVGVVSAMDRDLGHPTGLKFIQTDASITMGNSGGPLVNLNGEAIAINSMKAEAGFSFAIPIDHARKFIELAKKKEKSADELTGPRRMDSENRYIGIIMLTLTRDMLNELSARNIVSRDVNHGVLIHEVVSGSPAYRAGLQRGDIILSVDDKPVRTVQDVYQGVAEKNTLSFTIVRHGHQVILKVVPERS